jgi:acyl-CoA synthetase (AMP-forming)/AMP-acid ligase II
MLSDLPTAAAIVDLPAGSVWDGSALAAERDRRAAALADAGVGSGDRVAIVHGGTAAFFADLLAAWSLGAAVSCLDPALTAGERDRVVAFLDPVAVVDADGPRVRRPGGRGREPRLDDPGLILFTSGTTGEPKGVVLSFRALLARIALNIAEIGAATFARTLVTLPTHFGHGLIGNALSALHAGGAIVLPERGLPLANRLGGLVDGERVTFMSSVPTLWRLALKLSPPPQAGTLRRVHVGSAPLSAELWQAIVAWAGVEVVNCYGITETANWIAGASSHDGIANDLVGRPWGGAVAVLDAAGRRSASGEGEIVVLSPALMSGYLDRDDLTEAAFHAGWYRTGDRGEVDAGGRVRLTGRIKDEINRAGFKVQPAEIDHVIEEHPMVEEACTFALPDRISGETVAAAVRLADGAALDAEGLTAWLATRLRREATPERVFFVDAMPRTPRGKVSRAEVARALVGGGGR